MSIEQRVASRLNPVLAECLRQRTELGVKKYGQRLDDNEQDERSKAVHVIQELLDAAQYAEWMGHSYSVSVLTDLANVYQGMYELTAEEIMAGGKQ